jgi:hypothetical protein
MFIFRRLGKMRGRSKSPSEHSGKTRIGIFFAEDGDLMEFMFIFQSHLLMSVVGIFFGLIHCTGWFLVFPLSAEQLVWRVSAILISSLPFIVFVQVSFVYGSVRLHIESNSSSLFMKVLLELIHTLIPFYMVTRLALLAVAFAALRDLPRGAYAVVNWTSYLPHI